VHNYKPSLSNGTKTIFVLQCLHSEVKWHSQTLSFKSSTDKEKFLKTLNYSRQASCKIPSPIKLRVVIEDVRIILAPLQHVYPTYSFATKGH